MPRFHACVLIVVLVSAVTTSGCATATKLGYVPEFLTPSDTTTYIPTYIEVKKWAYEVADGYDSRAIINRRAGYAGAILAAAAVGAIAGLAAFDPGSSALTGIPIGTTFLAGIAYIFSSEEKARIYDHGSRYIKDLITLSDERFAKRRIAAQRTTAALKEAEGDLEGADGQLGEAEGQAESQKSVAADVHRNADQADEGQRKIALSNLAEAADRLALEAKEVVAKARLARNAAQDRVGEAVRRDDTWKALREARRKLARAEGKLADVEESASPGHTTAVKEAKAAVKEATLEVAAANDVFERITNPEATEALCLRKDVNEVMRKVEEHKAMLDPRNAGAQLKAVEEAAKKAKAGASSKEDKGKETGPSEKGKAKEMGPSKKGNAETAEPKLPSGDLSDLKPPVKSVCENAI